MEDELSLDALLRDWDADAAWLPQGVEPRGSVSRSSLCRRRQRQELLQLRSETVSLEKQLHRLRVASQTTAIATAGMAVWRRIAEHQREMRLESETDNARLRRLVREQRKVIAKLEKTLHHSRSVQEICEEELQRKMPRSRPVDRWQLGTELQTTRQEVVKKALQCGAFSSENTDCERVNLKTDASGRVMLESIYRQVFPFDLNTTTEAAWRCYSSTQIPMAEGSYSAKSTPSGQLVGCVELALDADGQDFVMWSQFLLRRTQLSPNRVLFVWEDLSESNQPDPSRKNDDKRVQMKFDAYIGVESLETTGGPSTIMRAYSLSRPGPRNSLIEDPIRVTSGRLVDVVQVFNRRFAQLVESYLLDEALSQEEPQRC